jgi:hypothetical protein
MSEHIPEHIPTLVIYDLELRAEHSARVLELYRRFVAGDKRAFAGQELPGYDLSRLDLRSADFEGADLTDADFTGARLEWASFDGARINGAVFRDAALHWAELGDNPPAKLEGAKRGSRDAPIAGYELRADHPDGWVRLARRRAS